MVREPGHRHDNGGSAWVARVDDMALRAYKTQMRRNLRPEELGDLLTRPLNAILALHRSDGSILQTPVWHEWHQGAFRFQVPAGDRKIGMLERDPRVSLVIAENEHPYRAIEVCGLAHVTTDGYRDIGHAIVARYVVTYDPTATVESYLSDAPGAIVTVEADSVRAWDYADEGYV
jgi:PPOX class probable F420-dependent enzyme